MLHPQLDTFFQVVESGSFARAAASRSCSAVSVMNQINSLEERTGIALLTRSSQGVALTKAGEAFYKEALIIRSMAAAAIARSKKVASEKAAIIRLGTSFLRSCKPLFDYLEKMDNSWRQAFKIEIITFNDSHEEFSHLQNNLGKEIDCFVSPCGSAHWQENFSIFPLGICECCVSLPVHHRLASKSRLKWQDLYGETLMLVAKGISPVLDRLRQDIAHNHPEIKIMDSPDYYDLQAFNNCVRSNYLMETPKTWAGLHPSLVTLPMEWDYALPYGIVYAQNPGQILESFINQIRTSRLPGDCSPAPG